MIKQLLGVLLLALIVTAADKEAWKSRSIYQLLTDRFARNDGQTPTCGNLGNYSFIKATTVEEVIRESSTIWTTFKAWGSMPFGFLPLSITEMEVTMDIGEEIFINLTTISDLKKIL